MAVPSFRCPKVFLGFSNSRSHSHLREKVSGQIIRFLENMGGPAKMCKHRHSFCSRPPSPRFKSAQSLHLLEAARRQELPLSGGNGDPTSGYEANERCAADHATRPAARIELITRRSLQLQMICGRGPVTHRAAVHSVNVCMHRSAC